MKNIYKISFGLFLFLVSLQIKGDGTKVNKYCELQENHNFSVIGDSRSELFWLEKGINVAFTEQDQRTGDALETANIGGKFIFPTHSIVIGNRATSGSHADGWVDKINECIAHNTRFIVASRSSISLGGNDIIAFYKIKNKYQEQYNIGFPNQQNSILNVLGDIIMARFKALRKLSVSSFINHPIQAFQTLLDNFLVFINPTLALEYELGKAAAGSRNVLRGKSKYTLNFSSFWDWQTGTKTDTIVTNMDIVLRHILNGSPDHKLIMNTVFPPAPRGLLFLSASTDLKGYPGLLKIFLDLRMKYRQRLFPPIMTRYPGNAVPLDLYDQFMQSIFAGPRPGSLFDGPSGELSPDGIHPSQTGNKFWGQQMAILMARGNWFTPNQGLDLSRAVFYGDAELDTSSSVIDVEAMAQGISDDDILKSPLVKIMGGYKKDFPNYDMSIYNKKGDDSAYPVSGLHLVRYKQEGETSGRLGFPNGGIYTEWYGTIVSQNFECGKIYDNHLDALQHFHTDVYSNVCPTPETE